MKLKFVSLVIVLAMLALVLTGCSNEEKTNPFSGLEDRFAVYDTGGHMQVYVDKQTGVCYLYMWDYNRASMTVMLDEDGRPLTYWEEGYE